MAVTLSWAAPIQIAAIDAGSNALRLSIARAQSPLDIEELESERCAVRLGQNVFTHGRLTEEAIARAVKAFRHFRARMDQFGVEKYRAVATSAVREARNRKALLDRVYHATGIRLEVIDSAEESRLGRVGVLAELGHELSPWLILDLGGGSLELNFLRDGALEQSIQLPIGTVRLMETFGITGALHSADVERLRHLVRSILESRLPRRPRLARGVAVACGGNAEALALLAPGPRERGVNSLNLRLLGERQWEIVRRDVPQRVKAFGIRRERAEVIGVAAVILTTLGRWLNVRGLLVPGVGVREGVLQCLAEEHFAGAARRQPHSYDDVSRQVLAGARWYARRLDSDVRHSEHVRELALSLFDQLQPLHGMDTEMRLLLEVGALLHDIGHIVSHRAHHKHGEYLVRHAEMPGLTGWRRDAVASLVRYHNRKSEPGAHHASYAALENARRPQVRALAGLLRMAEGLDQRHRQVVTRVEALFNRGEVGFRVAAKGDASEEVRDAQRCAGLFAREFRLRVFFRQAQLGIKVA